MQKENNGIKYAVNLGIAAIIMALILFLPTDLGLAREAVEYLAILAAMVFMLITGVFDEHIVILATLAMCVIMKVASFSTIFFGFFRDYHVDGADDPADYGGDPEKRSDEPNCALFIEGISVLLQVAVVCIVFIFYGHQPPYSQHNGKIQSAGIPYGFGCGQDETGETE